MNTVGYMDSMCVGCSLITSATKGSLLDYTQHPLEFESGTDPEG